LLSFVLCLLTSDLFAPSRENLFPALYHRGLTQRRQAAKIEVRRWKLGDRSSKLRRRQVGRLLDVRAEPAHYSCDQMAAEVKKEIAHVLFIDIVAYSKMASDDQRAAIEKL